MGASVQFRAAVQDTTEKKLSDHRAEALFGTDGAESYDADAIRLGDRYHLAHSLQNDLISAYVNNRRAPSLLLEFGCGSGGDAESILDTCRANYIGIDNSKPMLRLARAKLNSKSIAGAWSLLRYDIFQLKSHQLERILTSESNSKYANVFLCALSLHHSARKEKERIYALAHSILSDGGLAIFTDLFDNSITLCSNRALQTELATIRNARRGRVGNTDHSTLSDHHYMYENRPFPISDELDWMRTIGFSSADVVFRWGQLAVIVATK